MSDVYENCPAFENDKFKEWKNTLPFYKNLAKEGIVLWKNE